MLAMWSVKIRPKPGLASRPTRSVADTGEGFGRISKSRLSPPLIAFALRVTSWESPVFEPYPVVLDNGWYGTADELTPATAQSLKRDDILSRRTSVSA